MLVEGFPLARHDEIRIRFDILDNRLYQVRNDMRKITADFGWSKPDLQCLDAVRRIELEIKYWFEIGKVNSRTSRQEALRASCTNGTCVLDVKNLLDAIIGNGILDNFYFKTEGNRPRVSAFATRLLQVAIGGMMVVSTYETRMRGRDEAEAVTERFYSLLREAHGKAQSVRNRCVENFQDNMLKDLNRKLDEGCYSNDCFVRRIHYFMNEKYDWLENVVVVYNDLHGYDKHTIGGYYVHSFHYRGKCAVVFYRRKGELPRYYNRFGTYGSDPETIVETAHCAHAYNCYNELKIMLGQYGISKYCQSPVRWTLHLCRYECQWFNNFFSLTVIVNSL